jgi:hypothetical protein
MALHIIPFSVIYGLTTVLVSLFPFYHDLWARAEKLLSMLRKVCASWGMWGCGDMRWMLA